MCTNPILIRNRKLSALSIDTPNMFIKVPCGQCDECCQSRASSLYVRARMEFDYCIKLGGCGFMTCLTYSDDVLPTIDIDGKREMVFNKQHVIDFIKRLRINLERKYQKHFNCHAPSFKYLVTSEYGTSDKGTHRPHYHPLFFFREQVSMSLFKSAFIESTYCRRGNVRKRYFGYILQCDPLDPKRGGIKYSGKYILKDIMFEKQRKYINEQINFYRDYVNNLHSIIPMPKTREEELHNKCIRSSKNYRKSVSMYVRPWRSMLQFYLISNDLGVSSIIDKYGESLVSMPSISFEGFPYSVPKLVKQRLQQNYGYSRFNELTHKIFMNYLKSMFDTLVLEHVVERCEASDLLDFAQTYIRSRSGSLYLYNPFGLDIEDYLLESSSLVPWDKFIEDCEFFSVHGFFELRHRLIECMSLYDSDERRLFRASVAHERREKQINDYQQRKLNKGYKL